MLINYRCGFVVATVVVVVVNVPSCLYVVFVSKNFSPPRFFSRLIYLCTGQVFDTSRPSIAPKPDCLVDSLTDYVRSLSLSSLDHVASYLHEICNSWFSLCPVETV